VISAASYCIASEDSYATQTVHLSNTIIILSEVASHDRHIVWLKIRDSRCFFEQ